MYLFKLKPKIISILIFIIFILLIIYKVNNNFLSIQFGKKHILNVSSLNEIVASVTPYPTPTYNTIYIEKKEINEDKYLYDLNTIGISIVVPAKYIVSETENVISVGFHGQKVGSLPHLSNFSEIQIRLNLLKNSLKDEVKSDFKIHQDNAIDLADNNAIKNIKFGNINGYKYSCPFLVLGECIYLPHKNLTNYYILILTKYSDDLNEGYNKELEGILNSIKYIN